MKPKGPQLAKWQSFRERRVEVAADENEEAMVRELKV